MDLREIGQMEGRAEAAEEISQLHQEILRLHQTIENNLSDSLQIAQNLTPAAQSSTRGQFPVSEEKLKDMMFQVYSAIKKEFMSLKDDNTNSNGEVDKSILAPKEIVERCKKCIRTVAMDILSRELHQNENDAYNPILEEKVSCSQSKKSRHKSLSSFEIDTSKREIHSTVTNISSNTSIPKKDTDDILKRSSSDSNLDNVIPEPTFSTPVPMEVNDIQIIHHYKVGEGRGAYVLFDIQTTYKKGNGCYFVQRRYREFFWLWNRLCNTYKFLSVPSLPRKEKLRQNSRFSVSFLQKRQQLLSFWLQYICSHYILFSSSDFQLFIKMERRNEFCRVMLSDLPQASVLQKEFCSVTAFTPHSVKRRLEYNLRRLKENLGPLKVQLEKAIIATIHVVNLQLKYMQTLFDLAKVCYDVGKLETCVYRSDYLGFNEKNTHFEGTEKCAATRVLTDDAIKSNSRDVILKLNSPFECLTSPTNFEINDRFEKNQKSHMVWIHFFEFISKQVLPAFDKHINKVDRIQSSKLASKSNTDSLDKRENYIKMAAIDWSEMSSIRQRCSSRLALDFAKKMQQHYRTLGDHWSDMADLVTGSPSTVFVVPNPSPISCSPLCLDYLFHRSKKNAIESDFVLSTSDISSTTSSFVRVDLKEHEELGSESGTLSHQNLNRPVIPSDRREMPTNQQYPKINRIAAEVAVCNDDIVDRIASNRLEVTENWKDEEELAEQIKTSTNNSTQDAFNKKINTKIRSKSTGVSRRVENDNELRINPTTLETEAKEEGLLVEAMNLLSSSNSDSNCALLQNEDADAVLMTKGKKSSKAWDNYIDDERQKQRVKEVEKVEKRKKRQSIKNHDIINDSLRIGDSGNRELRKRRPMSAQNIKKSKLRLHQQVAALYKKNNKNNEISNVCGRKDEKSNLGVEEMIKSTNNNTTKASPQQPSPSLNSGNTRNEGGWIKVVMDDGREYYYHKLSRTTRWQKPDAAILESIEERMLAQQRETQRRLKIRRDAHDKKLQQNEDESKKSNAINKQLDDQVQLWQKDKTIIQMLRTLKEISPVSVTGLLLSEDPSFVEVKKTYMKIIRQIHPDKLVNAELKQRLLSQKLFSILTEAYEKYRASSSCD